MHLPDGTPMTSAQDNAYNLATGQRLAGRIHTPRSMGTMPRSAALTRAA